MTLLITLTFKTLTIDRYLFSMFLTLGPGKPSAPGKPRLPGAPLKKTKPIKYYCKGQTELIHLDI